jgi:hypothetical protein
MSESVSRRKILDSYEKKGVDLPIVTLEMVLDRETSAAAAAADGNEQGDKKKGFFGRFGKSEPKAEEEGNAMDAYQQNQVNASAYEQKSNIMEADEENVPVASPEKGSGATFGGAFCCPQPSQSTEEGTKANAAEDTPTIATEAGTLQSTSGADPSLMFCCGKNQTVEEEQYVKSNMQIPEGNEEPNEAQYNDIMNKGSLIDGDESVVTSNTEYRDEVDAKRRDVSKEDEHFWASPRFRWTMALCFILHAVLISLIVVVALNAQKNQEGAVAAPLDPVTSTTSGDGNATVSMEPPTEVATSEMDSNVASPQGEEADCVDALELSATCYVAASNVLVYFRSCTPQVGDWMAVYEATENSTNLLEEDSYSWMFTCGDRSCEGTIFSNVIPFNAATLLPAGATESPSLKVHLMREGDGPSFSAIASTDEFRVVSDGTSC